MSERFFKTRKHFENMILKVAREQADFIEDSLCMNIEAYTEACFKADVADAFGRVLRSNPTLLHEEEFWDWLQREKSSPLAVGISVEHKLTSEFVDLCESLVRCFGVYLFWNRLGQCLYVGMSTDLGTRMLKSFEERFSNYKDVVRVQHYRTTTASDAAVLEAIQIALKKPAMNRTGNYGDEFTIGDKFTIRPMGYEVTQWIECNHDLDRKREARS